MTDKYLLALMYDFYNKNTLRGQNNDIPYYINQIKKYSSNETLIIGAGTGRVAIPLSKYTKITALDFDKERLEILKNKEENIETICTNFLDLSTSINYDLIIMPYSTLQFNGDKTTIKNMLKKLREIMNSNTTAIFDVSESFNTKAEKEKEILFKKYCDELKDEITVYYSSKKYDEYIMFEIEYKMKELKRTVLEIEKYYYYDKFLLEQLIEENNLDLIKLDNGYSNNEFKHKHLYHCRRKK